MYRIALIAVLILSFNTLELSAQTKIDDQGFEIFEMNDGDTTWVMKKYYFCMLMKGPNRDHSQEETAEIQGGHMAHLKSLGETKKACIAGPFNEHEEYSGIVIYNTTTKEEAVELANQDPAVKAGRLRFEIVEWWAAKGAELF